MEYKSKHQVNKKIKELKNQIKFNNKMARNTWKSKSYDIGQIAKYATNILLTVGTLTAAMLVTFLQIPILWLQIVLAASSGIMGAMALFGNGYGFVESIKEYKSNKKDEAKSKEELKEKSLHAQKENKAIKQQIKELKQEKKNLPKYSEENAQYVSIPLSNLYDEKNAGASSRFYKLPEKDSDKIEKQANQNKKFSKRKTLYIKEQDKKLRDAEQEK